MKQMQRRSVVLRDQGTLSEPFEMTLARMFVLRELPSAAQYDTHIRVGAREKILIDACRVLEKMLVFMQQAFTKDAQKKTGILKCSRIAFSQYRSLPCRQISLKEISRAPKARARKFQASLESFRHFWVLSPQTRQKSSSVSIHCHRTNRSKTGLHGENTGTVKAHVGSH